MTVLVLIMLGLVAIGGTVVTCTTDPARQAVTLSVYGVLLSVLFLALAAPDVALSQVAVGSAVVPLMVLLAVRTVRTVGATKKNKNSATKSGRG
jgi:energy-converting hydrogenase B subunit D